MACIFLHGSKFPIILYAPSREKQRNVAPGEYTPPPPPIWPIEGNSCPSFALRGGRCPRCPRRPRRDRARRCFHCLSSRTARCHPRPPTASFPRGRLPCQQSRRTRGQQHCQQGNRWRGSPWRPASRPRLRSMRQRSPPKGKDPTSSSTRHCPREKRRAGTTSRLLTHRPRRRPPGLLRSPYRISTRHRRRQCHRRRRRARRRRRTLLTNRHHRQASHRHRARHRHIHCLPRRHRTPPRRRRRPTAPRLRRRLLT